MYNSQLPATDDSPVVTFVFTAVSFFFFFQPRQVQGWTTFSLRKQPVFSGSLYYVCVRRLDHIVHSKDKFLPHDNGLILSSGTVHSTGSLNIIITVVHYT